MRQEKGSDTVNEEGKMRSDCSQDGEEERVGKGNESGAMVCVWWGGAECDPQSSRRTAERGQPCRKI